MSRIDWKEKLKQTIDGTIVHGALPKGSTKVGAHMFRACSLLQDIEIPEGVTTIAGYAFENCTALRGIDIPSTCQSVGDYALYCCFGIGNITFPGNVLSIGQYALSMGNNNGRGPASITLEEGIVTINNYAFVRNQNITKIVIPNSVTTLGGVALGFCTRLDDVTIGSGISQLPSMLFREAKGTITSLTMLRQTPPTFQVSFSDTFFRINAPAHIYVPAESVDLYKAAPQWSTYADRIEAIPNS